MRGKGLRTQDEVGGVGQTLWHNFQRITNGRGYRIWYPLPPTDTLFIQSTGLQKEKHHGP